MWPGADAEQVHARVAEAWDFASGWPVPRFELVCPVCSGDIGLKDWRFFERPHATIRWRCDVTGKCTTCSLVLTWGVAVPEEIFRQHQTGRRYHWRGVRDAIEGTET